MASNKVFFNLLCVILIDALPLDSANESDNGQLGDIISSKSNESDNSTDIFNGVYSECLLELSYICLQKKTLMYIEELNKLNEVTIIGDYVKFVKLNTSEHFDDNELFKPKNSDEFAYMIDRAVDKFFENHLIRFSALGKDILVPQKVEEFVGRKRRKGGGGGGGGHGGGDGGKKKMMMMAMMCMKMKFMMMVPAMMGMMGMMSFKGMMFSMMSFMIAKMMLLMKILEKKGGSGGGGGDGGWAAGGGGGGAWMPAGGQDYGGGGGYDANGQWQSRSIIEKAQDDIRHIKQPVIAYVKPIISYNKVKETKPNYYDDITKLDQTSKSRRKRGIFDTLQNAYLYWANRVLGIGYRKPMNSKYRYVNGVRYVYQPIRQLPKVKAPKELPMISENELKPITDYNKGEIVEERSEGRMNRKKFHKMKDNVNETVDDNPWE